MATTVPTPLAIKLVDVLATEVLLSALEAVQKPPFVRVDPVIRINYRLVKETKRDDWLLILNQSELDDFKTLKLSVTGGFVNAVFQFDSDYSYEQFLLDLDIEYTDECQYVRKESCGCDKE